MIWGIVRGHGKSEDSWRDKEGDIVTHEAGFQEMAGLHSLNHTMCLKESSEVGMPLRQQYRDS